MAVTALKRKRSAEGRHRSRPLAKREFEGLPTEYSFPIASIDGYSWFVYGEKKIGKTTLFSQYPDPYFMMFEPGGKALKLKRNMITDWAHAKFLLKKLKRDKKFKTVIIDTADVMSTMCTRYVCDKLVIDHPSDEGWAKGWDAVAEEFSIFVNGLLALDKGIVFVSHARETNIKSRMGQEWNKMAPSMKPKAAETLNGLCDILAYYHYNGDNRFLTIRGNDFITAGHRLNTEELGIDAFNWEGKPVRHISMGDSPKEGYKNVVDCFNNEYKPVPYRSGGTPKKKRVKKKKRTRKAA